jgi:hypothetical protein
MIPLETNRLNNVARILGDISVLAVHLKTPGLSNTAKSAYYRAVIILACTVVEALVYEVIKAKNSGGNPVICSKKEFRHKQSISSTITGGVSLVICEPRQMDTLLEDSTCKFQDMNKFCKDNGYVTAKEFERLNYVRTKRNNIHVQGIQNRDRGYTKQQFKLIFEAILFLIPKI